MERATSTEERVNILLVDDQPESLLALRASLENEQYDLVTAASGAEALVRLLSADFAVVVLDVRMPGIDGFEVAELVRGRERSRRTPIIFLTAAYQAESDEFTAYEAGATDYVVKPVVPPILRAKVRGFVELYNLQRRLEQQLEETRLLNRKLEAANHALALSESQLLELNASLESRVVERTEALQKAEEKYRSIFENAREGIVQVSPDGRIMTANPALAHIMGYSSPEELLAAITGWDQSIDEASHRRDLQQQLEERGSLRDYEVLIRKKGGLRRWISISAHPVCGPDGALVCYEGTVEDITERKRTEDALRFLTDAGGVLTSSLNYEKTLKSIGDLAVTQLADWCGLYIRSEDGSLVTAALTQSKAGEASDHPELDTLPGVNEWAATGIARVAETGEPEMYSVPDSPSPGADTPEEAQALANAGIQSAMLVPLTARDKTLGAMTLISTSPGRRYSLADLSLAQEFARRAALALDNGRLYQESQAAVTARDHFLAVASHELKTPLTVITGYVELMKRVVEASARRGEGQDDEAPRPDIDRDVLLRQIDHLSTASKRLTQLVNDLLDINRMQTRSLELEVERLDLSALFSAVVENFVIREQSRRHSIRFAVNPFPGEISGFWDRSRLEQVLVNLIDNAIKYSSARGVVELALSLEGTDRDGRQAHLVVRDHGIGIPLEEQGQVFQPFMRATNAPARNFPGLGLGLAITREIVERHGGRIWLESAGHNEGSAFHVLLPILHGTDRVPLPNEAVRTGAIGQATDNA